MLLLNGKISVLKVMALFVQLWHFTKQTPLVCVSWKVLTKIVGDSWLISIAKHRYMWSYIYEKTAHSIKKRCELTCLHLSFQLFVSNYTVFFELLIIYLRVLLLQDVLLVYCIIPSLRVLVLDGTDTLSLFCMIEEDLILPFSGFIYNQRFHWCSVNKSLGSFAFVAFTTHIIVIALIASIIFAFIWNVIANHMVLFIWSLEILLFLYLICLFNQHLLMRNVVI
jgi:hypothetical protein